MSGITNPAELYFKNGLWAWDPQTEQWRKLEVTYGAHTLEVKLGASAEVHQDTPDDLRVGLYAWATSAWEKLVSSGGRLFTALHGWDGSAWRKLPMLFGYSEHWSQDIPVAAVGAGNAMADTTPVDAGYIHILEGLTVMHDAGVNKNMEVMLRDGTVTLRLLPIFDATTGVYYPLFGRFVLTQGCYIRAYAYAPGAGKKVYFTVWGHKMKIAE